MKAKTLSLYTIKSKLSELSDKSANNNKIIDEQQELKNKYKSRAKFMKENVNSQVSFNVLNKFDYQKTKDNLIELDHLGAMKKLQYLCASMSISGFMNFNQFFEILIAIGIEVSKLECSWMFKHLDNDKSGKVSFEEFKKLIKLLTRVN